MSQNKIEEIHTKAKEQIKNCSDLQSLDSIRVEFLGRKSPLNEILKSIKDLSNEEKKNVGSAANFTRKDIESLIRQKEEELIRDRLSQIELERIDITSPINPVTKKDYIEVKSIGHMHPIELARRKAEEVFLNMGFSIAESPLLESDYYNFEGLNIPKGHPARDIWDTFFTVDGKVMRTHTSAFQVRELEKIKNKENIDFRAINIGRCFRNEATDARHEHTFYQLDGLVVDKKSNLKDLIFTLNTFFNGFYETKVGVKIVPGYFPFVEPGFEMAITCVKCKGKNPKCSTCSGSGWLEILGCGMVHPKVFEFADIDPSEYTGFAFGMGFDRLTMVKYNIDDIRNFNSADLRLLEQFS